MTTTRTNILDRIATTLESVSGINQATVVKKPIPPDIETASMPCVFIYGGPEVRLTDSRAVMGKENWLWTIFLEVWTKDDNLEDLLEAIHLAMYTDRRLNNYAENSYRTSVVFWVVDVDDSLQAMLITYEVIYRHALGVM